jgi:hypothetical protein
MKTTNALRDFVSKDNRTFAEIERQFGWTKNTLNRIINRNQPFRDPILSNIQEVLRDKGYVLDELTCLPDYILKIRKVVFLDKKITADELTKKLGYSDVSKVYSILRGKNISSSKNVLILQILKEISEPQEKTVKSRVDKPIQKEKESHSLKCDQNSAVTYINFAVFLLIKHGADFLMHASKEERINLRKVIGQSKVFDATSIMAALNSEKAYERRKTSSQCID